MNSWRPQYYRKEGKSRNVDERILERALEIGNRIHDKNSNILPIFTLGHLAQLTGVPYIYLRAIVARDNRYQPYRIFRIRKKSAGSFRTICVPEAPLMEVQRYVNAHILQHIEPHHASSAYTKDSQISKTASLHCECRWLIKMDIKNFFESISELSVYRVFRKAQFPALLSFELARLCTRVIPDTIWRNDQRWFNHKFQRYTIKKYRVWSLGALPQGAPTSPMLSNLVAYQFDEEVERLAARYGVTYTRYADDIALSTMDTTFSREKAKALIQKTYSLMRKYGFYPNETKTSIAPPGAKKIVLGLQVAEREVRLTKEFKARLKQHLYFCNKAEIGPVLHAREKGFVSVLGFKNHLYGLITHAAQVEPNYAEKLKMEFKTINWPL